MPLHYDGEVRITKVTMGPYHNNGYIVSCLETKEGSLIDTPASSSTTWMSSRTPTGSSTLAPARETAGAS